MIARRRTSSASGPDAGTGPLKGRDQCEPNMMPAEIRMPKATTKNTISLREIRAWNCGAVKSTNRK